MSPGKAAAQAGHAWVDALLLYPEHPHNAAYRALRPGTKLTLDGGSGDDLLRLADKLDRCGAPFALIHDQGHREPPHFDGSLILTALGAGPFPRGEEPSPLKRLPLWSGGRWIMT